MRNPAALFPIALALGAMILAPVAGARADGREKGAKENFCLSAFDGTVRYQFTIEFEEHNATEIVLKGRTFGALASCAGLSEWPLIGTLLPLGKTSSTLGWRAFTVDADNCGAVDFIVAFDNNTGTGSLQLHNDRNNFGNTSTVTEVACSTGPAQATAQSSAQRDPDPNGN
jgi:hypothetical protein